MRSAVLILTKELPTKEEIKEILEPYKMYAWQRGEALMPSPLHWDYYIIGGRWGGMMQYRMDKTKDYRYLGAEYNLNHRKFISSFVDKIQKSNYAELFGYGRELEEIDFIYYMGGTNGVIHCDGAYIKDIANLSQVKGCSTYLIDNVNKKVLYKKAWDDINKIWIENEKKYKKALKETLESHSDCFLTVVEIHS